MRRSTLSSLVTAACTVLTVLLPVSPTTGATARMSVAALQDRVQGCWLGKFAGVQIGSPYEFRSCGLTFPEDVPATYYPSASDLNGAFGNDDVFVQLVFIPVIDRLYNGPKGIYTATMADYGTAFRNTQDNVVWMACGNAEARTLLRSGVTPPYSGMWAGPGNRYNASAEAIDWQIECEWAGAMCPGMPVAAGRIADSAGHVLAYANGIYGGRFMVTCVSLAFVRTDIHDIVRGAIEALPRQSTYYRHARALLAYHDSYPQATYQECFSFYMRKLAYDRGCGGLGGVEIVTNGMAVVTGLLYGDADIVRSIGITTRLGGDADCNAANVGAILGTMHGYARLPAEWKQVSQTATVAGTDYTWNKLIQSTMNRATKAIVQEGGTVTADSVSIAVQPPQPPATVEIYGQDPAPSDTTGFTDALITTRTFRQDRSQPFRFDAVSIGRVNSLSWDFGDGSAGATGSGVTHTYPRAATYRVALTASGPSTRTEYLFVQVTDRTLTSVKQVGVPIVSNTTPCCCGSKDPYTLVDGIVEPPAGANDALSMYDTWSASAEHWFGFSMPVDYEFTSFTFHHGGLWGGGQYVFDTGVRVQVRNRGTWSDIGGATLDGGYVPGSAGSYSRIRWTFPAVRGDGIRVIGPARPGGNESGVHAGEIDADGRALAPIPVSVRSPAQRSAPPRICVLQRRTAQGAGHTIVVFSPGDGDSGSRAAYLDGRIVGPGVIRTVSGPKR